MSRAVIKQPDEARTYDVRAGLPHGRVITAVEAVTITARGLVAENTALTHEIAGFQGNIVQLQILGGTDSELYLVTVQVDDDAGDRVEAEIEIHVMDLSWSVPEGPDATPTYIQPTAYVHRFGLAETIALTDESRVGRIDRQPLFVALADSASEIDAYLAKRYPVPLDPVPPMVESIAADLARERLHGGRVPDPVVNRATAARRQLRDLAQGLMLLPGVTEKTPSADTPLVEAPERIFTRDNLAGF